MRGSTKQGGDLAAGEGAGQFKERVRAALGLEQQVGLSTQKEREARCRWPQPGRQAGGEVLAVLLSPCTRLGVDRV